MPRISNSFLLLAGAILIATSAGCAGRGQAAPFPRVDRTTVPVETPTAESSGVIAVGQRPPTGFVPASSSFPLADTGFAWGVYPCQNDPNAFCSGLAMTRDGGATWKLRNPPVGTPIDPYRAAILRFTDAVNGWAVLGDQLQVTHDAAISWQSVDLPGLTNPTIATFDVGAAGVFVLAGSGAGALRLYRSALGASTFAPVEGVSIPGAGTSSHFSFDSDGSAYFTADSLMDGSSSLLFATKNGSTWVPRTSPCPSGSRTAVAAGPGGLVSVICDLHPTRTGADKQIWTSTNAGLTFAPIDGPAATGFTTSMEIVPAPPVTASVGTQAGTAALSYVVAASAGEDRLYLSLNAGRSWSVAYTSSSDASGAALGLAELQFSDSDHGSVLLGNAGIFAKDRLAGSHAVLSPRLLLTADGGKHWAQSVIR